MKKRNKTKLVFKRDYFNNLLLEVFAELHHRSIESTPGTPEYDSNKDAAKRFFKEEMDLDNSTITDTMNNIKKDGNHFTIKIAEKCNEMAEERAVDKYDLETPEDVEEINSEMDDEVSDEDREILDAIFDKNVDQDNISRIQAATAEALRVENQKAEEIKDTLSMISDENKDNKVVQEAINRITNIGPTSLLNAIIRNLSEDVASTILSEDATISVKEILKSNKDSILENAKSIYTLYETIHAFGFKKYSDKEIERISYNIYRNK